MNKKQLEAIVGSPLAIDREGNARRVARPPELERKPMHPPGLIVPAIARPRIPHRGSSRLWLEKDEQNEIVRLLRGLGWRVWVLSQPQRVLASPGVPDVLAKHIQRRLIAWVEVKSPHDPADWGPAQQDFKEQCIPNYEHYVLGSEGNVRQFLQAQKFDLPLSPYFP